MLLVTYKCNQLPTVVTLCRKSLVTAKSVILTVKPFMFTCPLFCKFHELNKAVKFKGVNIDTVPTLTGIYSCVGIVQLEFAKIKDATIILHAKSPTFRAATLKSFTALQKVSRYSNKHYCNWLLPITACNTKDLQSRDFPVIITVQTLFLH